jgi:cephalosporin-C deacetylase-like acetyl esterase
MISMSNIFALASLISKGSRGPSSTKTWILVAVFLTGGLCSGADAQDSSQRFADKTSIPLSLTVLSTDRRNNVDVYDITYVGSERRVPAYLVVPKGPGRFAVIVWAHWLMPGSAFQNRKEFLNEAAALAPSGVISLLIDAPQNRPGFTAEDDPLGGQQPHLVQEETVDLRRGLDLLLQRKDVDPNRVAFVGHSLGTMAGSVLDAVDKRFKAFVFMAGPQSVRELVLTSHRPGFDEWRKQTPASKIDSYLTTYAWADPETYAAHFGPAPALFQYALNDDWVTDPEAKHYLALVSGPKTVKFYNSGHALNAQARMDRFAFLQQELNLSGVPASELSRIPETR